MMSRTEIFFMEKEEGKEDFQVAFVMIWHLNNCTCEISK